MGRTPMALSGEKMDVAITANLGDGEGHFYLDNSQVKDVSLRHERNIDMAHTSSGRRIEMPHGGKVECTVTFVTTPDEYEELLMEMSSMAEVDALEQQRVAELSTDELLTVVNSRLDADLE